MEAVCCGSSPVVPITMATPLPAAIRAWSTVAAGTVKSITASPAPMAAPESAVILMPAAASCPSALLALFSSAAARLQPGVPAIWRISIWPMRPAAPATVIFIPIPLESVSLEPMLFMVVEKFKNQDGKAVYRKLRESGRALPDGLKFISSYVSADLSRCFQLMETNDVTLFQKWIADWQSVVEFEVVPVVEGKDTRAALDAYALPGDCASARLSRRLEP